MTPARDDLMLERFTKDTMNHEMTVLHDDGVYRHLLFVAPRPHGSWYWYELITVPGSLIFNGDGDSYVFRWLTDMFEFFRTGIGSVTGELEINPWYWSEKLADAPQRNRVMVHSAELMEQNIREDVKEFRSELSEDNRNRFDNELQLYVLESDYGLDDAASAYETVRQFEFYKKPSDEFEWSKSPDFRFDDVWEWDTREFDWWFLWSCYAIVSGIKTYDEHKRKGENEEGQDR